MAEPIPRPAASAELWGVTSRNAGLIQGLDAYLNLTDPAAGLVLEAEPFTLTRQGKTETEQPADKNKGLRPGGADKKTQPADKNKALRPEGAAQPADEPSAATLPPWGTPQDHLLLRIAYLQGGISTEMLIEHGLALESLVEVVLRTYRLGDSMICIPVLKKWSGFNTRIGNQMSIKSQVALLEGGATGILFLQVLYNPFRRAPGRLFIEFSVALGETLRISYVNSSFVPESADFKIIPGPEEGSVSVYA
jgi:hypothetical protein